MWVLGVISVAAENSAAAAIKCGPRSDRASQGRDCRGWRRRVTVLSSSGEMKCGSDGVEPGTTLVERAGDLTTGSRAGLTITLGDGATIRVGEVAADTGVTVGVMAVVNIHEILVRERSVSSPTV